MNLRYVFGIFAVMIFLMVGFVSSQECENVGDVADGMYCSSVGEWQDLIEGGFSCLNDYECIGGSCIESICESKFKGIEERSSFLQDVWFYFSGEECDPEFDTGYKCEDTIAFLCGADFVWEEKGEIPGVCGVPSGNSGDSGRGLISIYFYSPRNITYSAQTIKLDVRDKNRIARYWEYSLNGGNRVEFENKDILFAARGDNVLKVFASKYSSFSGEESKAVSFTVITNNNGVCGDGICDSSEGCLSCEVDCGKCAPAESYCGDGVCDNDESSFNCSEDCDVVPRKNRLWMFYTLVGLIIAAIGVITFILIKRIRAKHEPGGEDGLNYINHPPRKIPPARPFDMMRNKPLPIVKRSVSPNSQMDFSRAPKRRGVDEIGNP